MEIDKFNTFSRETVFSYLRQKRGVDLSLKFRLKKCEIVTQSLT